MIKESKKIGILLLILFLVFSCVDKKAKINYRGTKEISKNLYVEFYTPSIGGVLGNDLGTAFLTDSTSNEIFLGTMDDHQGFDFFVDSIKFKALKYSDVFISFKKGYKKVYVDSIIIDLKTFKVIDK